MQLAGQTHGQLTNTKQSSIFTLKPLCVKVEDTETLSVARCGGHGRELPTKQCSVTVLMCELCLTELFGRFKIQICQY